MLTTLLKVKTIRSVMDKLINPLNASFLLQLYDEYLRDENGRPAMESFFYLAQIRHSIWILKGQLAGLPQNRDYSATEMISCCFK